MPKIVPASKFQELKGLARIPQVVHEMKCLWSAYVRIPVIRRIQWPPCAGLRIWREISKDDIGIDGEIDVLEIRADGKGAIATGKIITVQENQTIFYKSEFLN